MRTSTVNISKMLLTVVVVCIMVMCCFLAIAQGNASVAYADTSAFEFYQGKYDAYTDSDSFSYQNVTYTIGDYSGNAALSTGNATLTYDSDASGGYALSVSGDNAITQIVPKELFQNNGDFTYIGKEYGFFINTTDYVPAGNKKSTVMVFDIATANTGLDTNAGVVEIKVEPLFQRQFVYLSPTNTQFRFANRATTDSIRYADYNISGEGYIVPCADLTLDTTLQAYVFRWTGDVQEYYLKDISYLMMLLNEQDPNEGNGGVHYDPYEDTGSYFTYFDYKYDGTTRRNGEFPKDEAIDFGLEVVDVILSTVLDLFIPGSGAVKDVIDCGMKIGGQITAAYNFGVGLSNWGEPEDVDISNGKITAKNYFANRDDQIEAYGKIVKAAGTLINTTEDEDSVWYKVGDSTTGYFQIGHSALNNQHKNLTRLVRQIGVKVVRETGEEVDAAIGSYNYMLREPQYKSLQIEEDKYLYLLDDGANYFMFSPQYTSDYCFVFETTEDISLKINGTQHVGQIESGTRVFDVRLAGGADYNIIVENHSGCMMAPFHVETFDEMSGIELGTDEYIVKISGSGMKRINVTGGTKINAVKELDATGQLINSSRVRNDLSTNSLDMMMDGEYYLILQNETAANTSITYTSVPSIGLEDADINELSIPFSAAGGMKYVRFTATGNETKGYVFSLCDADGNGIDVGANYRVYKADGTQIGNMYPLEIGSYYISLPAGDYYVGFYVNGEINSVLKVEESDVAFRWQVEYIDANGVKKEIPATTNQDTLIDSVTLPLLPIQGQFKFTLWINDAIPISNYYTELSTSDFINFSSYGIVFVESECPLGTTFRIEGTVPDNVHATFKHRIDVTVKLVMDEFAFDESVDYENAMAFSWTNQPLVQGYKFSIHYGGTGALIKTVENTAITKIDVLSDLITKHPTSAYVQLDQVKVNGNYISVADASKVVFSGTNKLDLNCMYSRVETKRVLLIFTTTYYYIANELQLYNIRNDQSYTRYLDNDITLSETWTPIPELTCSIYGQGHKIKNLSFYIGSGAPSPTNIGLVGVNKGFITNLIIDGVSVTGAEGQHFEPWYYIGAIAGQNEGNITLCRVTGSMSVHRAFSALGGIAGKNTGMIATSYFGMLDSARSYIYGNGDVGGIAGQSTGTISSCYTENADIRHYAIYESHSAGGIVGYCSGGKILSSAVHNINISNANPEPVNNTWFAPKMGMIVGHIEDGVIQSVGMANSTYGYGGLTAVTRANSFNGGWPFYGLMTNTQVDDNMNQNGP